MREKAARRDGKLLAKALLQRRVGGGVASVVWMAGWWRRLVGCSGVMSVRGCV